MSTKVKEKYITPASLISVRGWTRNMINELASNLNFKLVDNPFYKCAAPMKLYLLKDITRIERTKKFKELKEKADKRRQSAKKAVKTKTENTVKLSDTFSVEVERIDIKELRQLTLEEKQAWYTNLSINDGKYRSAYSAPEDDVERWMINFIRHNLSNYDEELENLKGQVGINQGYWNYKEKLAEEMKRVYPELKIQINKYMLNIVEKENIEENN